MHENLKGFLIYNPGDMWAIVDSDRKISVINYLNPGNPPAPEWRKTLLQLMKKQRIDLSLPLADPRLVSWKNIGELIPTQVSMRLLNSSFEISDWELKSLLGDIEFTVPTIVELGKKLCLGGYEVDYWFLYVVAGLGTALGYNQECFSVYACSYRLRRYIMACSLDQKLSVVARSRLCFSSKSRGGVVLPNEEIVAYTFLPKES